MNLLLKLLSFTGLALTVVPSVLVFNDVLAFDMHTTLMAVGMILWFGSSPFWMKEKKL